MNDFRKALSPSPIIGGKTCTVCGKGFQVTAFQASMLKSECDTCAGRQINVPCHYCEKPSVEKVVCADGDGMEVGPFNVCAECKSKHEF